MLGVTPDQAFTSGTTSWIRRPSSSGAFGTVYNARRRADGKRAALKLVLSTAEPDSADKLAAERRGRELQQQFGRSHGMVPEVYEYGPDGERLLHRDGVRRRRLPGAPHRRRADGASGGGQARALYLRVPRQGAPVL